MIKLENNYINLKDTLECGQTFRFFLLEDGSYDIIIKDRILNVKQEGNVLFISSNVLDNLKKVAEDYFALNEDYELINKRIIAKSGVAKKYVDASYGLNTLKQDGFEMLLTYIISASKSVSSIKSCVNKLSEVYGSEQQFNGKTYYLFPTPKQLKNVSIEDYRKVGVGFRDKYLYDAVSKVLNEQLNLNIIKNLKSEQALDHLMQVRGVGLKVASCILIFGYARYDVFPIDTWVQQVVMADFKTVKKDQRNISMFIKNIYGEYSGLVIQYMFNWGRNKNKK